MTTRRLAWIAAALLALPGFVIGLVTGYVFLIMPLTLVFGFVIGRSTMGVRFAVGILASMIIGLAFGLGTVWGDRGWLFYAGYGTSALLAIVVTFKLGTEVGARLWARSAVS